jgi:hypothetical protein
MHIDGLLTQIDHVLGPIEAQIDTIMTRPVGHQIHPDKRLLLAARDNLKITRQLLNTIQQRGELLRARGR